MRALCASISVIVLFSVSGIGFLWPAGTENLHESRYFKFICEKPDTLPGGYADELDSAAEYLRDFFRFSEKKEEGEKCVVRLFSGPESFESFCKNAGINSPGRTLLLYRNNSGSRYEIAAISSALHTSGFRAAVISWYLRNRISNPPGWLESGLAVSLDEKIMSVTDSGKKAASSPVKAALATILRQYRAEAGDELFRAEISATLAGDMLKGDRRPDPYSWAITEYLLDSGTETAHGRLLWEILNLLEQDAPETVNSRKTADYIKKWTDISVLSGKIAAFALERVTMSELLGSASELYEKGDFDGAENIFSAVLSENPENVYSLYYSGLINYSKGNYDKSLDFYSKAIGLGGDTATLLYASGLSLFASGRLDDAQKYIEKSAEISPGQFSAPAQRVLNAIKTLH